MENCVFCKIVKGEIPFFMVVEDDDHLAFLNIRPFKEGHTLVIPKDHIDYIFDMKDQDLGDLMAFSKKVADRLLNSFKPATGKIGVMVAGEEVPHVHIHLVPFNNAFELSFANQEGASEEELKLALEKILASNTRC